MGYLEGLLGGFVGRKRDVEQENIRQSDLASQRESAVLGHLMTSDDPDIRSAAVTGLLDSANPKRRKGGLAGWMGEMEQHPAYGRIRSLMDTPVTETKVTPGAAAPNAPLPQSNQLPGHSDVPDGPIQPQITQPAGNAGMATQSPVTGGPPPAPSGYAQASTPEAAAGGPPAVGRPPQAAAGLSTATPPPTPRFVEQAPTVTTTTHPRQVFMSPEQRYAAQARGKAQGDVEGEKAGLVAAGVPDAQATEVIRQRMLNRGRSGLATRVSKGPIVPDDSSETGFSQLMLDPDGVEANRVPAMDPAKTRASEHFYGIQAEKISKEPAFGGIPYAQQTPEGAAKVNAEVQKRLTSDAVNKATGVAAATGAQQIQTRLHMPIGVTAAATLGVSPTTTLAELQNARPMTEAEKTKVGALGAADESVQKIEELIGKVFPDVAPGLMGGIKTAFSLGMQKLGRSEDLAELDSAINLAAVNIARIAGETGRIPVQLVDKAVKSLGDIHPGLFGGDTRATALAKLKVVEEMLETAHAYAPGGSKAPGEGKGAPPASAAPTAATVASGQAYLDNGVWKIKK